MDGFMNLAKQGYAAYQSSQNEGQQQQHHQGQQQQQSYGGGGNPYESGNDQYSNSNAYSHEGSGGGQFGIQGSDRLNSENYRPQASASNMFDQNAAVQHAASQQGGDSNLFSTAMSFLNSSSSSSHTNPQDLDGDGIIDAHEQAYSQGNAGNLSADKMGAAAAMNAFKQYTSGGAGQQQQQSQGGGDFKSQLIGRAMSEAAKLFDQNGGAASGDKQTAVNSAAATVMKLLLKSQMSGTVGGGNSGGLGGLMSMASKFM
ncbi:prion domain-containing protein RNQ1 [Sporobolomyces koalae]|uniref:prion domain-containing protein RNQ1 n=1 Tax=Sporobolomyces koalae TaxID=500713 RepID=UPI00316F9939